MRSVQASGEPAGTHRRVRGRPDTAARHRRLQRQLGRPERARTLTLFRNDNRAADRVPGWPQPSRQGVADDRDRFGAKPFRCCEHASGGDWDLESGEIVVVHGLHRRSRAASVAASGTVTGRIPTCCSGHALVIPTDSTPGTANSLDDIRSNRARRLVASGYLFCRSVTDALRMRSPESRDRSGAASSRCGSSTRSP